MDNETLLLLVNKIEEKMRIEDEYKHESTIQIATLMQKTKQNTKMLWWLFTGLMGSFGTIIVMLIGYIVSKG